MELPKEWTIANHPGHGTRQVAVVEHRCPTGRTTRFRLGVQKTCPCGELIPGIIRFSAQLLLLHESVGPLDER